MCSSDLADSSKLNFGTLGQGSFPELVLKWLNNKWGADIAAVPFRGGGPIAQAIAAGDLQIGNIGGVAASLALRQEQDMGRIEPVRIIMLLDRDADVYMAQLARADGWLVKPLDSVRLRRAAAAVQAGEPYFEGMLEATN